MKILINISGVKFGGAFTSAYSILRELAGLDQDDDYYVFVSKRGKENFLQLPRNFHLYAFPLTGYSWIARFIFDQIFIPLIASVKRVDIIMGFNFASFLAPCPQIIRITQSLCFSKIVAQRMWSQGIRYVAHIFIHRFLILSSIKRSERVVFISESVMKEIGAFMSLGRDRAKYIIAHNGVDAGLFGENRSESRFSERFKDDDSFKILYPSFYKFHKDFPTLLRSVPLIRSGTTADFKVVLNITIGDLPKEDREFIITELLPAGLGKNIVFLGPVAYEDMGGLYNAMDIAVFPTFAESFLDPLPESMISGLPIVATDIPIHREVCQDAALYFSVFDQNGLADKIILLMKDKYLYSKLSDNGKKRSKDFSWRKHVSRILMAMKELTK